MEQQQMFPQQQPKDPDASLVVVFKAHARLNPAKTTEHGRPIYDDEEIVEVRFPGRRDYSVFPATAFSDWVLDPFTGEQKARTYAERFSFQYRQFKANAVQTKQGTPLEHVPFLSEGKRAELRALNVYTIETLAHIDGEDLKRLGQGGRELKNKAIEYIEQTRQSAPNVQLQAELEALRARNQALEDDNKAMAALTAKMPAEKSGDDMLDDMSDSQLKDYIAAQTGNRPVGNPARRNLLRMAMDARPGRAA
jgi:hypothetical protein